MSLSRTALLALTAIAAFGAAIASPTSASAWHGGPHWNKHHHNHHWRPHYRPYVYAAPVVYRASAPRVVTAPAPTPNPASCLSKAYTPEGQVVFSDNCTKESAMAPVPGVPQQQSEAPAQQNFAGKTFQDFQNSQNQNSQKQ